MKKLSLFLMVVPVLAFADLVIPDGDPFALLLNLFMNYKAMAPLAIGASLVVIVVQLLKKSIGDFPYKLAVVAVLSVVYSVLMSLAGGVSLVQALVAALITGGGAIAIYEAIVNPVSKAMKKA